LPTQTFDWGQIKWFVSPDATPDTSLTFGEVILMPGKGHDRHDHPDSEEILYVLSGSGEQMIDDNEPFAFGPGDTVHIPAGLFHSTLNTGWGPLRLLAVYNPGGAEKALTGLPDFRELPPGSLPEWRVVQNG
jgi:oxalate decarboxylase/phosphoglucose isomerase-like protein (cupin superfamily)